MKPPNRSLIVMCTAALVGGTGGAVIATEAVGGGGSTVTRTESVASGQPVSNTTGGALSARQIYDQSAPSVAFITAQSSGGGAAGQVPGGGSGGTATGSGFVISSDGYIVTNAHVINGADTVLVKLGANGKTQTAKVVGTDESTDIALLKVDGSGLKPLSLANSSDVQVGDPTYAIGSPYGLDLTLTTGVVSALNRSIESPNGYAINGVLQTDAALNPGNSGGPLIDAHGRVVGVNSQIATGSSSQSGGNVGVGFAVPSDTVARIVEQLRASGHATHAYLGVGTTGATSGTDTTGEAGATVASVAAGGPAADAGLRVGDVITGIDDAAVANSDALGTAVDAHKPGTKVTVSYKRDGKAGTASVTLGTRPAGSSSTDAQTAP